jgi:hypothetical protein
MKSASYIFDISMATDSGVLLTYLADAINDGTLTSALTSDEKRSIRTAVADRFNELAVTHVENNFPKGRWTVERGTARLKPEIEKTLSAFHSRSFSSICSVGQLDPFAENPS